MFKKTFLLFLATAMFLPTLAAADSDKAPVKPTKPIKLPSTKTTPVLVLDYQGGFTPPRTNDDPAVLIRADGVVILGAPFGHKKRIETKISDEKLQALLRFALVTQQIEKFDEAKVKEEMRKGRPQIRVADAGTTVIRVHANGKKHKAKFYALSMMASQYPKIKELAQLEAVRKRIESLRTEINAGGPEGVAKNLKLVNARLKSEHPELKQLSAADLQSAWQRANGDVSVSFQRSEKLDDGQTRYTSGSVNYQGGEVIVSVRSNVAPKR